jgi:BirA family transcriptional regulator, biotin operon repressor / biotin---[acetyl-CoA-carboxylase] ligase
MPNLIYPAILIRLGQAGDSGLPLNADPQFQEELDLCRRWGFRFQTAENRVSLLRDQDQLIPCWIQEETPSIAWACLRTSGFLRVNSTNSEALNLARQEAPEGTLVYAEEQTTGRGRKNRTWHSPAGAGLYFTLVLRPSAPLEFWPLLTHVSSVALVETLKELAIDRIISSPLDVDLKWPNDVLLSGKKCAGILLESLALDTGKPAAVVGIGINVRKGSVPEGLEFIATSIEEMAGVAIPRRQLLVNLLHHFQLCYLLFEQGNYDKLLDRWKSHSSMYDGVPVWMGEGATRRQAITCGLNEMGALLVRTPDGKVQTVYAEDIRISRVSPGNNS